MVNKEAAAKEEVKDLLGVQAVEEEDISVVEAMLEEGSNNLEVVELQEEVVNLVVDRDEEAWAAQEYANLELIAGHHREKLVLLFMIPLEVEIPDLAGKINSQILIQQEDKVFQDMAAVEIPIMFVNLARNANLGERLVRENIHKVEHYKEENLLRMRMV